jgi:putative membrane protein
MQEKLARLHGAEFDKEFAKAMTEDHKKAIEMVRTARAACNEKDLCALLEKVQPVLEKHLRMAEDLSKPAAQGRRP